MQKNSGERDAEKQEIWMLFDPAYTLVSQAVMESKRGADIAIMRPIGDRARDAMQMRIVIFSLADEPNVVYRGEVGARRGGKLYLEMITRLEPETGRYLRVNMEFSSKLVCLSRDRPFRAPITSVDLSAGGLGFACPAVLEKGDVCEVVIPVTETMLVLKLEIRWVAEHAGIKWRYGGKFIDLADEEETMLRQTIFSEQWRRGKCRVVSHTPGAYRGQ